MWLKFIVFVYAYTCICMENLMAETETRTCDSFNVGNIEIPTGG